MMVKLNSTFFLAEANITKQKQANKNELYHLIKTGTSLINLTKMTNKTLAPLVLTLIIFFVLAGTIGTYYSISVFFVKFGIASAAGSMMCLSLGMAYLTGQFQICWAGKLSYRV